MKRKVVFEAFDGTLFEKSRKCRKYEKNRTISFDDFKNIMKTYYTIDNNIYFVPVLLSDDNFSLEYNRPNILMFHDNHVYDVADCRLVSFIELEKRYSLIEQPLYYDGNKIDIKFIISNAKSDSELNIENGKVKDTNNILDFYITNIVNPVFEDNKKIIKIK